MKLSRFKFHNIFLPLVVTVPHLHVLLSGSHVLSHSDIRGAERNGGDGQLGVMQWGLQKNPSTAARRGATLGVFSC